MRMLTGFSKYITPYGENIHVSVAVFLPRAWWPLIRRTGNEESLPLLQKEYHVLPVHALKINILLAYDELSAHPCLPSEEISPWAGPPFH